jgi:hypothetical protein
MNYVTGEWRKLHSEELRNLYTSPDIIRHVKSWRMRWHAWEKKEKCTRFLWESPKERRLGKPSRRWENGIKMDLTEIGWGVWIGFYWLRTETGGQLL